MSNLVNKIINYIGTIFTNGDYIIEKGTKNNWDYRLYKSGFIEATCSWSGTLTHYTIVNNFHGYYTSNISLPFEMADTNYYINAAWRISNGFAWFAGSISRTTTTFNCYALSTSSGSQTCYVEYYVKGYIAQ